MNGARCAGRAVFRVPGHERMESRSGRSPGAQGVRARAPGKVRAAERLAGRMKAFCQNGALMPRRKTTVYLDEELLRATKVLAARTDRREYEVIQEALRAYLGFSAIERARRRSELTDEEAMNLAVEEVHAARAERAAGAPRPAAPR